MKKKKLAAFCRWHRIPMQSSWKEAAEHLIIEKAAVEGKLYRATKRIKQIEKVASEPVTLTWIR